MHGRIREQANALNAQVGQNSDRQADRPQNASAARLRAFAGAQLLVQNKPRTTRFRRNRLGRRATCSKASVNADARSISKPREVLCR